jgi:S1-C subfamily serine protease
VRSSPEKRVLTTAELVENSTYIELELPSTGEKTPAKIVGLDYEANLALLEPIDGKSKILDNLIPLKLDDSVGSW